MKAAARISRTTFHAIENVTQPPSVLDTSSLTQIPYCISLHELAPLDILFWYPGGGWWRMQSMLPPREADRHPSNQIKVNALSIGEGDLCPDATPPMPSRSISAT